MSLIKAVLTVGELGVNVQINAPQTLRLSRQVSAPGLAT
jgi:ribosomal protein S3